MLEKWVGLAIYDLAIYDLIELDIRDVEVVRSNPEGLGICSQALVRHGAGLSFALLSYDAEYRSAIPNCS